MKKLFGFVATTAILILPAITQANEGFTQENEGFYAGASAGVNFLNVKSHHHFHLHTKTGYSLALFGGYKFCNDFSLEAEVNYRNNGLKSVKHDHHKKHLHGHGYSWSFMVNTYYQFQNCGCDWGVDPYVGVGIGYDRLHYKNHRYTDRNGGCSSGRFNQNAFAWQVMAGLNYALCYDTILNLEYKFHQAKGKFNNNSISIGAKKLF